MGRRSGEEGFFFFSGEGLFQPWEVLRQTGQINGSALKMDRDRLDTEIGRCKGHISTSMVLAIVWKDKGHEMLVWETLGQKALEDTNTLFLRIWGAQSFRPIAQQPH